MNPLPLCVDCDGTLVHSDLLMEAILGLIKHSIWYVFVIPLWMLRGKAYLKMQVAQHSSIDADTLPYNEALMEFLRREKDKGRQLVLVTGAPTPLAATVAEHTGLFSETHATTADRNLTGPRKRDLLCSRFGEKQYEYAGNSRVDLPIWHSAAAAIVVNAPERLARSVARFTSVTEVFPRAQQGIRTYARALRIHQWVKNLLVFVPLLVSHQLTNSALLMSAITAFACFSLTASSVYIVNDLLDLPSDRLHPRKRVRPFAAGQISIPQGLGVAVICLVIAGSLSLLLPVAFQLVLGTYLIATTAYSVSLKSRAVVDVLTLGGLYTLRIIAGSAATVIFPSFWLLALSMFLFLSLAVVKRYAELLVMNERGETDLHGRGYAASDLPLLIAVGVANGVIAVLVLALYVNSPDVGLLYAAPEILWLAPPLLLYWISRIWLKTHRGEMHDDPIVFASSDRPSLIVAGLVIALLIGAALYQG